MVAWHRAILVFLLNLALGSEQEEQCRTNGGLSYRHFATKTPYAYIVDNLGKLGYRREYRCSNPYLMIRSPGLDFYTRVLFFVLRSNQDDKPIGCFFLYFITVKKKLIIRQFQLYIDGLFFQLLPNIINKCYSNVSSQLGTVYQKISADQSSFGQLSGIMTMQDLLLYLIQLY